MKRFARATLVALLTLAAGASVRAEEALKAKIGVLRLSSSAPLYTPERLNMGRFHEGIVYYWPQWAQQKDLPPLRLRLLRLRRKKADVWLLTNVLDAEKLPRPTAFKFYRWRWRNEGLFRSYKRTLGKVKLMSRTVAQVHREAEGSLLATQLLLAQGALALQTTNPMTTVLPSSAIPPPSWL